MRSCHTRWSGRHTRWSGQSRRRTIVVSRWEWWWKSISFKIKEKKTSSLELHSSYFFKVSRVPVKMTLPRHAPAAQVGEPSSPHHWQATVKLEATYCTGYVKRTDGKIMSTVCQRELLVNF